MRYFHLLEVVGRETHFQVGENLKSFKVKSLNILRINSLNPHNASMYHFNSLNPHDDSMYH